jgi:hypothetical protein
LTAKKVVRPQQIDARCRGYFLQMRLFQPAVSRPPGCSAPDSLRDRSFDPGSSFVFFTPPLACRFTARFPERFPRGKTPAFWGIDQEFFFSPVYHFERLREIAPDAKARAATDEFYEKTQLEFKRAIESRNPSSAFILTATAADFDRLEAAFGSRNAEAKQILRHLRESAEIYQKNSRGEIYANNLQRSRLLKRNFMSFYNAALKTEKQPKVFFKFGASHVTRGRNFVNVFDLGNMVSELAESQGTASFHVLVIAAGGTYNKFFPFIGNEADKQKKLVPANVYSYAEMQPFLSLADSSSWKVIDLRPLRPLLGTNQLPNLPRGLAGIISGFDAVVLVNEAHPATFFTQ